MAFVYENSRRWHIILVISSFFALNFLHFLRGQNWTKGAGGRIRVCKGFLTDILKKRFKEGNSPNKNLFVEVIASEHPTVSLLCVCVSAQSNLCC